MVIGGEKILVLAPLYNTGTKKDATGAFQPEALAFAKRHKVPRKHVAWIDNSLSNAAMRRAVLSVIERARSAHGDLLSLALCCHGWKTGIQFGFDRGTVGDLAASIYGAKDVRVVLYACGTAQGDSGGDDVVGGDGGFADLLRDTLCRMGATGCQVDAHTTAGHTTKNPYVRRFQGMGSSTGGAGGFYIVRPSQKTLFSLWNKALKNTPLRYDFPFMTVSDIHAQITE